MSLVKVNWNPTDRQLRQFGVIALVLLPCVGWVWSVNMPALAGLVFAGAVLAAIGWIAPQVLKYPFLVLSVVTAPIGIVVGELVLSLIYVGVFLPIGMLFRLVGRDALSRNRSKSPDSYWTAVPRNTDRSSYFRQY